MTFTRAGAHKKAVKKVVSQKMVHKKFSPAFF